MIEPLLMHDAAIQTSKSIAIDPSDARAIESYGVDREVDRRLEPRSGLPLSPSSYRTLERRIGRVHLKQRLGIESDHEAQIFGQGRNFFHIENLYFTHSLIRGVLKCVGLYSRGKSNALNVQIRANEIDLEGLPSLFDGYTILHISDLHLDMNPEIVPALIERVSRVDYDLCVITGDFRAKTFGAYEEALMAMKDIRRHLSEPVYGVLGNHDSIRMVPGLEEIGIRMLLNESVPVRRETSAIYLAGIDDPHYYRADNLEKASYGIPHGAVSILLAHSPEIYQRAAHADFDVMLCGHTHGGQICLPGGIPVITNARCPRHLCAGAWKYHGLAGYTSVGSGSSIVGVRLNCLPEITLHHLRCGGRPR